MTDAVTKNANFFKYASPNLRKNRDLALAAVRSNSDMYEFIEGSDLQGDTEILMSTINTAGHEIIEQIEDSVNYPSLDIKVRTLLEIIKMRKYKDYAYGT
jgi:hypothetical protein